MKVELNPKLLDIVEFEGRLASLPDRMVRGTVVDSLGDEIGHLLVEVADETGAAKSFVWLTKEEARKVWTAPVVEPPLAPDKGVLAFEEGILLLQNACFAEAKDRFRLAFQHDSRLAGSLSNFAAELARREAFESAIAVLSMILDLQPQQPFARENLAITYLNRGVSKARSGAVEKALDDFNLALLAGPSPELAERTRSNLAAAYTQLGTAHAEKHEYQEALTGFVLAFELNTTDTTRKNIALASVSVYAQETSKKSVSPEESSFLAFLRMGLTYSECLNAYGATLAGLGFQEAGIRFLRAAVRADPDNVVAQRNLSLMSPEGLRAEMPPLALGIRPLSTEAIPQPPAI